MDYNFWDERIDTINPCKGCNYYQDGLCLSESPWRYPCDEERQKLWDEILDKILIIQMVQYCDKHKIKSLSVLASYAKEFKSDWYNLLLKLGYKDKNE